MFQLTGFDIGGTKCAVCIGKEGPDGFEISDKRVMPTDRTVSPYEMIDRMCAAAVEMGGMSDVVGISCGGPLDAKEGVILSPPNLPGWDEVRIVEYLEQRYPVRAYLENDANACALAEWQFGAGERCENMIFLTFGTGLGAGLILNGKLYAGTNGMAGEVGHVRLADDGPIGFNKAGSFEGFCSGGGLAQLGQAVARERLQGGKTVSFCKDLSELANITAKSIAMAADNGHADAIAVYELCGTMLGKGLSMLIDILNPERIVIGSIYQRSENLLKAAMERELQKECLPEALDVCRVVPAKLKENIGDYAALAVGVIGSKGENGYVV